MAASGESSAPVHAPILIQIFSPDDTTANTTLTGKVELISWS